jgi:hypothetical protein
MCTETFLTLWPEALSPAFKYHCCDQEFCLQPANSTLWPGALLPAFEFYAETGF